jgi:LDH2 family malate/lactate/ureidoglycolate dehydrogenase
MPPERTVTVPLRDARRLCRAALRHLGFRTSALAALEDYFINSSLRGVGGLERIADFASQVARRAPRRPISIVHQTPISAALDGGGQHGYLVAHRATGLAIAKAKRRGIAVVGASNTQITGNFGHYMELATKAGLIGFAAGSSRAAVAPHGGSAALLGTNPLAFGFPARGAPVIWDVSTAALSHAVLRQRTALGTPLDEGMAQDLAYDAQGRPTCDAAAALTGALRPWGGHRGSGLAIVAQLFGILAGAPVVADRSFGFFILAMRPDLLLPAATFKRQVATLAARIAASRPRRPGTPPRVPFARSARERRHRQDAGLELSAPAYHALTALAQGEARVRR